MDLMDFLVLLVGYKRQTRGLKFGGSVIGVGLEARTLGEVGSHSKGRWSPEEDKKLQECKAKHGERRWDFVPANSGLKRSPKSCRDRWLSPLAPEMKITEEEHEKLFQLHSKWGNKLLNSDIGTSSYEHQFYSMIARELPGRTYEQVRNYYRMMDRKKRKKRSTESTEEPRKPLETKVTTSYALESADASFSRNNTDICSKLESVGKLIPKVMQMARELLEID
ncbi:MYB-like transcription factor EOBI [Tripterygium wilfordii]|uniref:MYB-like transcription factor EOBI n=1 Tax=Tripterygium wilfordii TaxID=458696 RepID=UPI0018F823D1|nr:MYB-like transcription factor EOBI [Tripterygium wilfordii]